MNRSIREPLLQKSTWVSLASALILLLISLGVDISDELKAALGATAGVFGPLIVVLLARKDVTPVADPRDNNGNCLVPVQEERNA